MTSSDLAIPARLDHVIVGVPDLQAGIAWFTEQTSVEPRYGGSHPELGTHNAMVALGEGRYLELLARDPAHPRTSPVTEALSHVDRPTPFGWAVSCDDAKQVADQLAGQGVGFQHLPLHRTEASGRTLEWQVVLTSHPLVPLVPFFIDWAATPHPSSTAPAGCSLRSFALQHEDPAALNAALAAVGVSAAVEHGAPPGMRIVIESVAGALEIAT